MRCARILAALAATLTVAACTSSSTIAPGIPRPSARLGTVAPAYPVGDELEPGIQVIDHIPTEALDTSGSVALDPQDPCRGIPTTVVTPAGFDGSPLKSDKFGCGWFSSGSGLGLELGDFPPQTMAREVAEHIEMANGRGVDKLSHLAWLLVDGHYVIERILKFDQSGGCWLSLDLRSRNVAHVIVYALDLEQKKVATNTPEFAVAAFCPRARTVAQNLLRHLLPTS